MNDRRQDYPRGPPTKKFSLFFSIIIAAIFGSITNDAGFSREYRMGRCDLLTLGFWKPPFSRAILGSGIREETRYSNKTANCNLQRFCYPEIERFSLEQIRREGLGPLDLFMPLQVAAGKAEQAEPRFFTTQPK